MSVRFIRILSCLVLISLALSACAQPVAEPTPIPTTAPTEAPKGFDWKRYDGETIRLMVSDFKPYDDIRKMLPEFEEKTGIKVIWDQTSGFDLYIKQILELTANPENVDVFILSFENTGYKMLKEGWLEDLTPYLNDPAMTSPDYDYADFIDGVGQFIKKNNIIMGMPDYVHTEFIVIRKDIFEKNGLTCADIDTFDKLQQTAEKLNDPDHEFYGISYRGGGYAASWQFSNWLWSYGGDWLDNNGKPNLDTPEAIAAATKYGDILRLYGPPGTADLDDGRNKTLFLEGRLGIWYAAAMHISGAADPAISKVADKVEYCLTPSGPTGRYVNLAAPTWSISSGSKHKGASWYLVQWLTSKDMQIYQQVNNQILMSRQSAWDAPEFIKTANPSYLQIAKETFSFTRSPALPPAEDVAAIRTVVGKALEVALTGGDVGAAMAKANQEYIKLIDVPMSLTTSTP